jgi:hypothetical protein
MKISFDFNPSTKKITNISVEDQPEINTTLPIISIENNTLVISKSALELIGAVAGDRIAVNYWTVNNEETFPVIGKSEVFDDPESGLLLSKKSTIRFQGQNRTTLLEYGSIFILEVFKNNMFKLVKFEQEKQTNDVEESSLNDINDHINELEDEINSIIRDNDLPF